MKLFNCLILGLLPFTIADPVSDSKDEISNRLDEIDTRFKSEGASLDILSDYDSILNELEKLLLSSDFTDSNNEILNRTSKTKFKHGLINLILKREKLAFLDFKSCIVTKNEQNGEFLTHKGCFERFVDIGLKFGNYNPILNELKYLEDNSYSKLFNEKSYLEAKEKVFQYKGEYEVLDESIASKDWEKCVSIVEVMARTGSNDDKLIRNKIKCLMNTSRGLDEKAKLISQEYNKLVNEEINTLDLNDYVTIGGMDLFGITGIYSLSTDKVVRNCLKIDNEFEGCRNLNKVNFKLSKIMKIINEVSIYYSYVYSDTNEEFNEERLHDIEISKESWSDIIKKLFDRDEKIKLKNVVDRRSFAQYGIDDIDKYNNNFEIILDLFSNICLKIGFTEEEIEHSTFVSDFFKLVKEGYFEIDDFKSYKKNTSLTNHRFFIALKEIRSKRVENRKDVVDIARELDSYIKKKKIDKANELLNSLSNGIKSCRLVRERHQKIEEILQGERQQRQQQQYQQQQQQQRQRAPSKPFKPKNDYYKILGISKDANGDEIKKAYRQKMKENHPDKVKQQQKKEGGKELSEDEIETRVAEINNAYEILSDEEKRRNYDNHGEDPNDPENARQRQEWQQQQGGFHGGGFPGGGQGGFPGGGQGGFPGGFPFNFGGGGFGGGFNGKVKFG